MLAVAGVVAVGLVVERAVRALRQPEPPPVRVEQPPQLRRRVAGGERRVVIEDGGTTDVRVVSSPAGRVAFRLRTAAPPASGHWQGLRIRADAGGVDVPFRTHADDQTVTPWPLDSIFYLAEPAFPPGRHGFVVTVDGYQPAHCDVDVVADRLSTANVELTAR